MSTQSQHSDTDSQSFLPDSNDSISEPSTKGSSHGHRAKKRKLVEHHVAASHSRFKRLKPLYNDRYRRLFNDTLESTSLPKAFKELEGFKTSQIGITFWSAEEKLVLFDVLARKGRHDIQRIAIALENKSESEVQSYLKLIRDAMRDWNVHAKRREHFFDVSAIDAAAEVSPSCDAGLESLADALSMLQYREEEKIERARYSRLWLLTSATAKWVDQRLNTDEGQEEVSNALPAAHLLDLKAFLKLSKRFFMNSVEPECNWRTYTERRKAPSIMQSAFLDLHTLALSFIKRIIQSSLFCAMSRIRSQTSKHRIPKGNVQRRDVLAALNVLGLEAKSDKTWINVPRKCNLRVYENVRNQRAWGDRYSYDEVEQILATHDNQRGRYRSKTREMPVARSSSGDTHSTHFSDKDPDSESLRSTASASDLSIASDSSSIRSNAADNDDIERYEITEQDNSRQRREQQELLQEAYMEALDQTRSQIEEQSLWKILGDDPTTHGVCTEIEMPKKPLPPGKSQEDLVDWTDWLDYAAEWETLDMLEAPVPAQDPFANRIIRKKPRRSTVAREVDDEEMADDNDVEDDDTMSDWTEGSGNGGFDHHTEEEKEDESGSHSGSEDGGVADIAENAPDNAGESEDSEASGHEP
ncbi:MAG: hypothetical protein Q9164_003497 [Protoblastenia rupestris]